MSDLDIERTDRGRIYANGPNGPFKSLGHWVSKVRERLTDPSTTEVYDLKPASEIMVQVIA